MLHVDKQYIFNISPMLRNFKVVNDNAWRFSCCYCGDSLKNSRKTRGNIYFKNHNYMFKCFNCGISKSIQDFIKDIDPKIYEKYLMDNYKAGSNIQPDLSLFGVA